jgi:hypothetical protein
MRHRGKETVEMSRILQVAIVLIMPWLVLGSDQELGKNGKMGVELVKNKSYDRALRYLEDGLGETPNNPLLYEYQGLAYLGCSGSLQTTDCLQKAEAAMMKAIENGGQATIIVDRSMERGGIFSNANVMNVKRGAIHITKTQIVFEPDHPDDKNPTVTIPGEEIKEAALNRLNGKSTNVFHISIKKETYNFRTANFSADEAEILFRLMEKYMGYTPKSGKEKK